MRNLTLVPDGGVPPLTGEVLHAKLLDMVDMIRGCAMTLDGAVQTAFACARADPTQPVERFDVALDAIATGSGALVRQLEMFRAVIAAMNVRTSPLPPRQAGNV